MEQNTVPFFDPDYWPPMPKLEPVVARPVSLTAPEFTREAEPDLEMLRRLR